MPYKPQAADDILHDFAVAESLREATLSDKLKRGVITADEFDDLLVELYIDNKAETLSALNTHYLNLFLELVGEDEPEESDDTTPGRYKLNKYLVAENRLRKQLRQAIKLRLEKQ
jgi:hypothetical protein